MSTRCQIEFRSGSVRRTVYRHWDGYPSAVIPDLLAFLAWSRRRGVEYETANFLYWSKRDLSASDQLGFGVCAGVMPSDAVFASRYLRRGRRPVPKRNPAAPNIAVAATFTPGLP
jgi:hypothetical protein